MIWRETVKTILLCLAIGIALMLRAGSPQEDMNLATGARIAPVAVAEMPATPWQG